MKKILIISIIANIALLGFVVKDYVAEKIVRYGLEKAYTEMLATHKGADLAKYVAADAIDHNALPGQRPGGQGIIDTFTAVLNAFPKGTLSLDVIVVKGNLLIIRSTREGDQLGPLLAYPASGKHVKITSTDIYKIQGGKLVEHWGNFDSLGLFSQIGVVH